MSRIWIERNIELAFNRRLATNEDILVEVHPATAMESITIAIAGAVHPCMNVDELCFLLNQRKVDVVPEKSVGHLFFKDDYEYYEWDGHVYRAPSDNPVMPSGRRYGRYEAPRGAFDRYQEYLATMPKLPT